MIKISPWTRCPGCGKIHVIPQPFVNFVCPCGNWKYEVSTLSWKQV